MDSNNHIGRERKKYLEVNDAQTLLEFLKNKQLEDPSFFYAIQLDEEVRKEAPPIRFLTFFPQFCTIIFTEIWCCVMQAVLFLVQKFQSY